MSLRLVSWNVNGYRAVWEKNFRQWLGGDGADIACIQETRARPGQLTGEQKNPMDYSGHFAAAERKGYSGVATFCREQPAGVTEGIGQERFDREGRVLTTEHLGGRLLLGNIYVPNGYRDEERYSFKMDFFEAIFEHLTGLAGDGRHVILCGDFNAAHRPIDLARPERNEDTDGFKPSDRTWIERFLDAGFADAFRIFHEGEEDRYTWWNPMWPARERGVGWRIDYHLVSESARGALTGADIHENVTGSDHCPVSLTLDPDKL